MRSNIHFNTSIKQQGWGSSQTNSHGNFSVCRQYFQPSRCQRSGRGRSTVQLQACVTKTAEINAVKLKSLCWQGKCRRKAGKINMGLQQMLEFIYILMATALIGTCRRCQAQRACPADPDCQHSIAAMNIYYNRASLSYNELYSPTFIWVLRHTYFKTCLADGLNFKTKYKGQSDMYMCY